MAPQAPRLRSVRSMLIGREAEVPQMRKALLAPMLAVILSLVATLLGGVPAQAEPSIAEVEKQIDEMWRQLEPTIEKHNATREDLAAKKKQAKRLGEKIAPLQLQVDLAMAKVGRLAENAYKGDRASALNAVLTTGSPAALIDRLEVLDQYARLQQRDIQEVSDLKEKYEAQKQPLDKLVAELTQTEKELAAKKKQIDAEVSRLQKLRIKLYGTSGYLGNLRPVPCPPTYPGGDAGKVVKFACAQIGKPYVWGSSGPNSYDCSGLILRSWAQVGVSLPHNAKRMRSVTRYVNRSELRPGDLVFYYRDLSHVGMYVGDGWIVHASTEGVPVKMKKMDDGNIHSFGRP
ncbi:MAG TPA: NlpC/P60 family protein [Micromonosporaceae bacterium]|nr:NlpC/P60 family protein [Micromonosporaceae bacterium]